VLHRPVEPAAIIGRLEEVPACTKPGQIARAAAALPMSVMNSRRFLSNMWVPPQSQVGATINTAGAAGKAAALRDSCPLHRRSGSFASRLAKSDDRSTSASPRKRPSCCVTANCREGPTRDSRSAATKFHHSITSSARAKSVGGIVNPSALAVFRLMTSSNLTVCWTGRSAGLAPLRSFPT
jgi:hypothetical protein